uniref:Uncharacterized protein n=1 Tax=Anguilla anguilla TaxID=7936 RepID=A0A0E9RYF2_ANGAN
MNISSAVKYIFLWVLALTFQCCALLTLKLQKQKQFSF